MFRHLNSLGWLLGMSLVACADADSPERAAAATPAANCLPAGDGFLRARLRGAINADLNWSNDMMSCEGGVRPDGRGLRAVISGRLPTEGAGEPVNLRLIFGIDLHDSAAGPAEVLPTNLTVILEGRNTLFSTGGNARCAVESFQRKTLLAASAGAERIEVRGYCTAPATDVGGTRHLLVSTFDFAGKITLERTP